MITQRDTKGRIVSKYSAEQRKWIVEHQYSFSSIPAFLNAFNEKFNGQLTLNGLYGILRKDTGIRSIRKTKGKQYQDWQERIDYLKEHYPYEQTRDTLKEFNKKFNENYTEPRLRDFCNNNGIKKNTEYSKEYPKDKVWHRKYPNAKRPIGTIIKGFIKVKDDDLPRNKSMKNYMPLNRYVYEQAYGKIANGYKVLPYDGNKDNLNIDNLYIANAREILWLKNQNALGKGIITKAALENIRLEQVLIDKGIIVKQKFDPNRLKKWNEREREKRRYKNEYKTMENIRTY